MTTCVIMHNMIMEEKGETIRQVLDFERMDDHVQLPEQNAEAFEQLFLQMHHQVWNRGTHTQLQNDLVEPLWAVHMDN